MATSILSGFSQMPAEGFMSIQIASFEPASLISNSLVLVHPTGNSLHQIPHHHASENTCITSHSAFCLSVSFRGRNTRSRLITIPQSQPRFTWKKAEQLPFQLCPSWSSPLQRQLPLYWSTECSPWDWEGRDFGPCTRRHRTCIRSTRTKRYQRSLSRVEHCR